MAENFNNFGDTRPTDLTSFMIDEIIQLYGVPTYYLKKSLVNLDRIFGEDSLNKFEHAVELYLLPENPEQYGGSGDNLGNFGFEINDTVQMIVEMERFKTTVGENQPSEDDLVYIPTFQRWFQVSFTADDRGNNTVPFFWNGKNGAFQIDLLTFQYSHERIATGVEVVDDNLPITSNQIIKDNDNIDTEELNKNLLDEFDELIKK